MRGCGGGGTINWKRAVCVQKAVGADFMRFLSVLRVDAVTSNYYKANDKIVFAEMHVISWSEFGINFSRM
jgi:hypothetical protein